MSVGTWDEPDLSCLPLPPTSPSLHTSSMGVTSPGGMVASPSSAPGVEAAEFVVEYTTLKGVKEKVRVGDGGRCDTLHQCNWILVTGGDDLLPTPNDLMNYS